MSKGPFSVFFINFFQRDLLISVSAFLVTVSPSSSSCARNTILVIEKASQKTEYGVCPAMPEALCRGLAPAALAER